MNFKGNYNISPNIVQVDVDSNTDKDAGGMVLYMYNFNKDRIRLYSTTFITKLTIHVM